MARDYGRTLGGNVERLRLKHGWSQKRLAREAGLSFRTVQQIEYVSRYWGEPSLRVDPRVSTIVKLAKALGQKPEHLISKRLGPPRPRF